MIGKNKRRISRTKKVSKGNSLTPRIIFYKSNKYLFIQAFDDLNNKTIASIHTKKLEVDHSKKNCSSAEEAGKLFAFYLKEKGISKIFFDRNGYKYCGKIKSFCDSMRRSGIIF